jgi:hypothetical protein
MMTNEPEYQNERERRLNKSDDWKKKELKPTEREVPTNFEKGRVWKPILEYWKPAWWQRVQILFGFNVVIHVKAVSQHNPGVVACSTTPSVTKFSLEELTENLSGDKSDLEQKAQ